MKELKVAQVSLNSKESAEAWATLVEKSQETIGIGYAGLTIDVKEDIGAEGWAAVRRVVMDLQPPRSCMLVSELVSTGSGKREDISGQVPGTRRTISTVLMSLEYSCLT